MNDDDWFGGFATSIYLDVFVGKFQVFEYISNLENHELVANTVLLSEVYPAGAR